MDWAAVVRVIGFLMILLYLLCGIDDTIWFIFAFISGLLRGKKRETQDNLDFEKLRNTPPKMLAVSIAAWHESNVIGNVITNFLNTTDYPKSMYHLFVGVYPNDPETIAAVEEVSKVFPNVHAVINCKEGPTTKAQNINHVIRQIREFEKDNNIHFASLTIHDSEDVIHTYELLATNYLIDDYDALQFPVFPIMEFPRLRNFFSQITSATYADEFAENHYITMVERRDMDAFVPCAGTGFALSRRCLDGFADGEVLPSESLTEDYLLSLMMYKKGIKLYYVLNKLPRVMKNGKVRNDFITTRSLFPNTFKAAIRQKTRWTYGITMQSISMKDVFATKGISFAGRYSFYKDLKAKVLNLITFVGYVAIIYCILAMIFDLEPFYRKGSPVYYMAIAVFVMMIIREMFRGYALYNVYGMRSAFFGVLFPPLFPIRLIYGNIINFVATVRAFKLKLFGDNATRKRVNKEHKEKAKKEVKWSKTDHDFLTRDQLRVYRRMLGDTLIVQGYLTAKEFNDALEKVDKEHGQQIGSYLIEKEIITEEQMIKALGHVKHVQFIPDSVARKLDYEDAIKRFDSERLKELRLLPLTFERDKCIVAICNETKDENLEAFKAENNLNVVRMYVMETIIDDAHEKEPSISVNELEKKELLDSLDAYHKGELLYEQVILIGMYAELLSKTESEIRQYMGI